MPWAMHVMNVRSIEGSKKLLHVLYQVAIPVLMTQAHGFMNARVHTQNKVNTMG